MLRIYLVLLILVSSCALTPTWTQVGMMDVKQKEIKKTRAQLKKHKCKSLGKIIVKTPHHLGELDAAEETKMERNGAGYKNYWARGFDNALRIKAEKMGANTVISDLSVIGSNTKKAKGYAYNCNVTNQ